MVPGFTGSTTVPLVVPLTYDLDIASTKYLHGLDGRDVPLLLLFSGTVFTGAADQVQLELVPWHEEAAFRLPVAVWRAAMDAHFPDAGWVRLRQRRWRRCGPTGRNRCCRRGTTRWSGC